MQIRERERKVDAGHVEIAVARPSRRERAPSKRQHQKVALHAERVWRICRGDLEHRKREVERDHGRLQLRGVPAWSASEIHARSDASSGERSCKFELPRLAPFDPLGGSVFVDVASFLVHRYQPPLPPPPPPPPPPPEKPPPIPDELEGGENAAAVALENSLANDPMVPMLSSRLKFE